MIELSGLRKRFGRTLVLDGIDLRIGPGDRVALIGSNGAGKTTLIRCLLGQYVHDGTVVIGGESPRAARTGVLRRVAFVPQMPPPLRMPAGELADYAAGLTGSTPERIGGIAERLGLDLARVRGRPFLKLSGGQKQKLLIAIAMGRDADVLIMDEPTANLDPAARRIVFDLLAERLGKTMIISSHRLEEVAMLVNRVIEMERGKVVLDDRVEEADDPAARLDCVLRLKRPDDAFARAMAAWGFEVDGRGLIWEGRVAGPDRLRFLGLLARYSGLLAAMEVRERGGRPARAAHG